MNRQTVFIGTKEEYHRAVICTASLDAFLGLGFVRNVSELKESESGSDYEKELRDKIKALGEKPGGRSSIDTLEKQLARLQDDSNKD